LGWFLYIRRYAADCPPGKLRNGLLFCQNRPHFKPGEATTLTYTWNIGLAFIPEEAVLYLES
jgi:hypothetical protein